MKRIVIRTLLIIFALLQLIIGLIIFAPFTEIGSRALLIPLAKFLPVEIEYAGGRLFGELHLSSLKLDTPDVQLNIKNAVVELEYDCLWRSTLCLRNLAAQHIEIQWDGGQWRSANLQAKLSIFESKVEIDKLYSADVSLRVFQGDQPASELDSNVVSLPVDLVVTEATLDRVDSEIYGVRSKHKSIQLSGDWIEDKLTLHLVELDLGAEERGTLHLKGELTFVGDWPFKLNALANLRVEPTVTNMLDDYFSSDQLQALPEFVSSLILLSPWKLSASGTLLEQSFSLESAVAGLGYDALQLSVSGQHLSETEKIVLDNIELSDSNSASALSGSAELVYSEHFQWAVKAQSSHLTLPAVSDALRGYLAGGIEASGEIAPHGWAVALQHINVQGEVNDLPAKIEGQIAINQALKLSNGNLRADIDGARVRLSSRELTSEGVDLELKIEDLSRWLPDSSGALELTAAMSADLVSARVDGQFSGFGWQEISVERGEFGGVVSWAEEYPFQLEGKLEQVSINSIELNSLTFSGHGMEGEQSLQLASVGDIDVSLAGIADFSLLHSNGSLTLDGNLQSVAALLPDGYDLKGELQLTAQTNWEASDNVSTAGNLTLIAPELRRAFVGEQAAKADWDELSVGFERDLTGLQLRAVGVQDEKKLLSAELFFPEKSDQTMEGQLEFNQLDVAPFQAFIPSISRLNGVLNGQLALSGSREKPLGYGELKLSEGGFSVLNNPTELEAVELGLVMNGDKANIDGGLMLGGGRVDISGILGFNPEAFVELQLSGERQQLLFPPSVQLEASHNIHLSATADFLKVTGDLTVHSGVLEHEQLPEGGVALSEDVVIVGYTSPASAAFDMAMDVQVTIEDQFKVVGSVVDVTVGGDLHLLQERRRPLQLFGSLNVVGGELRAYRQHLQVRRGTVAFSGLPQNPTLDMRAERVIFNENITVGLELTGTLADPVLEIYSDPIMSRTETFSYLIRGRGLDANASADGAAFALAMGASLVNETGLLQQFDKIPGINSVELSSAGSDSDTTATVSGYIGNRIYLAYGIGLYEPINVLTARLYLQTRLWLEVVSSLENSLDLYYSFDID